MDDAKDLRERARAWRETALHQKHGAADAILEAACELEVKATRVEREQQASTTQNASRRRKGPRMRVRLFARR